MEQEYAVRQDAQTVMLYGETLVHHDQWDKARTLVQKALNQGAVDAELMRLAARIESHFGEAAKADAYAQAARAADQSALKHEAVFFTASV